MSEETIIHENTPTIPSTCYNNYAQISGIIQQAFSYSHTTAEKKFYSSAISVKRDSGTMDIVPIVVSEDILPQKAEVGMFIEVKGSVRSSRFGQYKVFVFLNYIHVCENEDDLTFELNTNYVLLTGTIYSMKGPRQTPLGRTITDVFLRITQSKYNHWYTLPCITWGLTAIKMSAMKAGDSIRFFGRFQSREYFKRNLPDSAEGEYRTTYEISVIKATSM